MLWNTLLEAVELFTLFGILIIIMIIVVSIIKLIDYCYVRIRDTIRFKKGDFYE